MAIANEKTIREMESLRNSKGTNPKLFFYENLQKIIEDLHLFTEKSEICISVPFNVTEIV